MNRVRLPLAAVVLALLAACQSAAPTAPADPRTPTNGAQFSSDSVSTETARGGSTIGSGT